MSKSLSIFFLVFLTTPLFADEAPDYRRVVTNALAFLDGDGAKIAKGSCINCHHYPLRSMAIRDAGSKGVVIDAKALQEGLEANLKKLGELKDGYRGMQWGHSLSSFYLLGSAEALPQEQIEELAKIIVAEQDKDGSWKAAQQFGNQRRPKKDAHEVQTMWSVLALSKAEGAEALAARDKALEWLAAKEHGTTIDARVLRVLVEQQFGKPERSEELLKKLLASQRDDGGFGWQPDDASDAWATGLALYALTQIKTPPTGNIERARAFLAKTQQENGSWLVEGKLTAKPDVASYFGTAWAIVGISRSLEK